MSTAWTGEQHRTTDDRRFAELVRFCVGLERKDAAEHGQADERRLVAGAPEAREIKRRRAG